VVNNRQPYWALADEHRVGFIAYSLDREKRSASIDNFYVLPSERRQGYGTVIVQAVYACLDRLGVQLIELNVRRDTPQALAFWESQGFRIASYRLHQYRDPKTGTS